MEFYLRFIHIFTFIILIQFYNFVCVRFHKMKFIENNFTIYFLALFLKQLSSGNFKVFSIGIKKKQMTLFKNVT